MANKYAVETAFKIIDQATAPLANIGVKGNAIGKQLKKDFMKAQDQLAGLGKAAKKAGIAIVAAGAAAAGAFAVKGVKDAIEFNTAFTKVSTVADTTRVSLNELNKALIELSNSTGVSAAELAEYQYQAITAGIDTADSVTFLSAAVKTSRAAFTDTGTVIDSLTSVINAYGLEASSAERIAGQMYIATNTGKTSFEELNGALGKVLPTAARLNVGTDELFASIAALTANAVETPKAVKGIEKILESVQNPTANVSRAARRLGIDFSAAALESKGLAGFLEDIKNKTGGSEEAIMSLFGSVDSLNAINILTSRGAETFTNALYEMGNAAGVVDAAFNTVMESPAQRWGRVMNKIKNAGISLGTALLPMVEKVMGKVEEFVNKIKDFDFQPIADKISSVFEKIFGFINLIIKFAGVIYALRVPILAIVGAVALYRGGMLLAAAAVNGFTAAQNIAKGVQLVAALITGNQTKAMALYKAGTMGASFQTLLFAARQKVAMGLNFAGSIIKQGAAFIALKAQLIAAKVATIALAVAQKAAAIAGKIAAAVQWALNAAMSANPIGLIIIGIIALIAGIILLIKNWDKVKEAILGALSAIGNFFKMIGSAIGNFFKKIWDTVVNVFKKIVDFVKNNMVNIINIILTIIFPIGGIIMALVRLIIKHWDKIKETAAKVWNGVKDVAGKAWEGIKNVAGKVSEGIKNIANKTHENLRQGWNNFKENAGNAWNSVKEIGWRAFDKLNEGWNKLKNIAGNTWEGIKAGADSAGYWICDKLGISFDDVKAKVRAVTEFLKDNFNKAWGKIKEGADSAGYWICDKLGISFDDVKEKIRSVVDFFKEQFEGIKNFFSGIGDKVKGIFARPEKLGAADQAPPQIQQITTETAGAAVNIPSYGASVRRNDTVTAATVQPTRPITTAEQYQYRETTNRDQVEIAVRADQGSQARVTRPPRSPNVRLAASGGNNG